MILTGVIGGVIVIIAIAMVIILCQRREKKPEGKEVARSVSLLLKFIPIYLVSQMSHIF
jgi:Ca2+/Na+ antiporter